MKSKISLFTRFPHSQEMIELKRAAAHQGANLRIITLRSLSQADKIIPQLGSVIIWRSSYLTNTERTAFLKTIARRRFLINQAICQTPDIARKTYQQSILENFPDIEGIPSYRFSNKEQVLKSIQDRKLHFPLVIKTDIGSQGKGVALLKNKNDIQKIEEEVLANSLFQNFIKSDGDYRVLVFGGKVLGTMKRVSQDPKNFRNNISQGGKAIRIADSTIKKTLTDIALTTAAVFDLYFTGVDIIYNQEKKKYQVIEVNTVPQWRGLQTITPFNIADQIIRECRQLIDRNREKPYQLIKNYYETFFPFLSPKKFHYASRMFLWQKDKGNRQKLAALKRAYLGKGSGETKRKLSQILQGAGISFSAGAPLSARAKRREPFFKKYPHLRKYLRLLFKNIFANIIYHRDLRPIIKTLVGDRELLALYRQLIEDEKAIQILSSYAINYFYLLKFYFRNDRSRQVDISPERLYQIGRKINHSKDKTLLELKIYLFTHSIIGASAFYSRPIDKKGPYLKMIKTLERLIRENFFAVSLDNKLEFLVSANILDYQSSLKNLIYQEADRSLSDLGNFIIDRANDHRQTKTNNFIQAEHRNVLYLISHHPYPPNQNKGHLEPQS